MSRQASFTRITIVGVGLIGGSLGMALKKAYPRLRISGYDKPGVLKKARERKAIDVGHRNLKDALSEAELVILAIPVDQIIGMIPKVAELVTDEVTVTDVGSVKKDIARLGRRHFPGGNFVGGHPVAGSEQSGIQAGSPDLFRNRPYILTPHGRRQKSIVSNLSRFLAPLGVRISVLTPEMHDQILAALSHLPQLSSVALMNTVGKRHPQSRSRLELSGTGLMDTTRMGESSFAMWRGILRQNRREIIKALDLYLDEMRRYRSALKKGGDSLDKTFDTARQLRKRLSRR